MSIEMSVGLLVIALMAFTAFLVNEYQERRRKARHSH